MASRGTAALLNISGVACQKTWSRQASRITKYKNPFVGGIYKKTQLPLSPRDQDEYATEGESIYPDIPGEYPPGESRFQATMKWYSLGFTVMFISSLHVDGFTFQANGERWIEEGHGGFTTGDKSF